MTTIDVGHGFKESERDQVGALYWEAFRRKLGPGFTNDAVGLTTIQAAIHSDRMLVARIKGEIAGVCGYHEQGAGAANLSWDFTEGTPFPGRGDKGRSFPQRSFQ